MMTTIWAGLSVGAIYAIVAIGYNIVYVASARVQLRPGAVRDDRRLHRASRRARAARAALWLAIIVCAVVGALIGALEELLAIRWLRGRGAHNELVTTLGVATILSGLALRDLGFGTPAASPTSPSQAPLDLLGGRVLLVEVLLIVVAAIVVAVGAGCHHQAHDDRTRRASPHPRIARPARCAASTCAGSRSGAFVARRRLLAARSARSSAPRPSPLYNLGDLLAVKAFVALAIGGFGSYPEQLIGGFVVGLLEVFAARYLGSEWQNITVFVLLLVVLLVIPHGVLRHEHRDGRSDREDRRCERYKRSPFWIFPLALGARHHARCPSAAPHRGTLRLIISIALLALLVVGLNIAFGYAGELALGQSAIYAVGAYFAGYFAIQGLDLPLTLVIAIARRRAPSAC